LPLASPSVDVDGVDELHNKVACLETTLQNEVHPQLEETLLLAMELTNRVQSLQSELATMASARLMACEQVGQLTKQQLAEIKQMARNPPSVVRRLLVLLWSILHCERFQKIPSVKINEQKDWPRCKRMLADDGFVARILNFDPNSLGAVPKVLEHVEASFASLGLGNHSNDEGEQLASSKEQESCPERPSHPVPSRHARRIVAWSSAVPAEAPSKELPTPRGRQTAASKSGDCDWPCGFLLPFGMPELQRTSTPRSPQTPRSQQTPRSVRGVSGHLKEETLSSPVTKSARGARMDTLPPVLTIPAVARASAPCGVLFRWMQELVAESRERAQLQKKLNSVGIELKAANERKSSAEALAAALEAELSKARLALVSRGVARKRAEEIRTELIRKEAFLSQQRQALRNEQLDAGVKACVDLEKEILIHQVRRCNKLGGRRIQLPALR